MPYNFESLDKEIAKHTARIAHEERVRAEADRVTPEQAARMATIARSFPVLSPGVVRSLGQSGMSLDDPALQFAITQEFLKNHSTLGSWNGSKGFTQNRYDPEEYMAGTPAAKARAKHDKMERLLKEGKELGVFDEDQQILVEPEFPEDGKTLANGKKITKKGQRKIDVFRDLQDGLYEINKRPVPYVSQSGKIYGYTPQEGTVGPREIDFATGRILTDMDRRVPYIEGKQFFDDGRTAVGGTLGTVQDFGAAEHAAQTYSIARPILDARKEQEGFEGAAGELRNPIAPGAEAVAGMPGLGPPKAAVRGTFAAFDAPLQELQGLGRNIYGQFKGEDVNWFESQSDLGIILPQAIGNLFGGDTNIDMGGGFFIDPESAVARTRRAREAARGQINGSNITFGRMFANALPLDPNSKPYLIASGLVDGTAQIFDPTALTLGGVGKLQKARKLFTAADYAEAGAFSGIRKMFHGPTFDAWANKNSKVFDRLAEINDPLEIFELTKGKLDPELIYHLYRTDKPQDIRAIIDDAVNQGQIRKTTDIEGNHPLYSFKRWSDWDKNAPPRRKPRILETMPQQFLDYSDKHQVATNLVRSMRNAKVPEETVREVFKDLVNARTMNGMHKAVYRGIGHSQGMLVKYGLPPEIASVISRTHHMTFMQDGRFLVDEIGTDIPNWSTITSNGEHVDVAGPHLPLEHIQSGIYLPDQRTIRRLTSGFNFLFAKGTDTPFLTKFLAAANKTTNSPRYQLKPVRTTRGGHKVTEYKTVPIRNPDKVGDLRLPFYAVDWMMGNVFKPSWLLRLAWPVRVIGEEQIRMAADGLISFGNNPYQAMSIIIGSKQTRLNAFLNKLTPGLKPGHTLDITGEAFDNADELAKVTYKAHMPWLEDVAKTSSQFRVKFHKNDAAGNLNVHELPDYRNAWAHELALLHRDPVSQYVASHTLDESVDWFMNTSSGNKWRKELREARPGHFDTKQQITDYLQSIVERQSRITGNNPDLQEMLRTGKFHTKQGDDFVASSIIGDQTAVNPVFAAHLDDYLDVGPDVLLGSRSTRFRNADGRLDSALDTMFSMLMGTPTSTLSRSPAFRQYYYRHVTELLQFTDDPTRAAVLAAARDAGITKRQIKALERAAQQGRKAPPGSAPASTKPQIHEAGDSPLDYKTGETVHRLAIRRPGMKPTGDTYFKDDPELVAFLDYSVRGNDEIFIHFMSTRHGEGNKGMARALLDDLYGKTTEDINWGEIVSDEAEMLWRSFRDNHPDRWNKAKGVGRNPDLSKPDKPEPPAPLPPKQFEGELNVEDLDMLAKGYALEDTRNLLYDLSERSQFFDIYRNFIPFGEAWREVLGRWAKLATITGPGGIPLPGKPVRRFQQLMQGGRGTDFGELMGAGVDPITGEQRGFFYTNEFGQEVFTFPFSEAITGAASKVLGGPGGGLPLTGSLQGLNMFGNILPGVGPVVQIPAAHFLRNKPGLDWWREQLLPFGGPGTKSAESFGDLREWLPAFVRPAWDAFVEDGRDTRTWTSATMYTASYLASTGKYGNTPEEQQRLHDDASKKARSLFLVLSLGKMVLPTSPQISWSVKSKDGSLINARILAEEFYEAQFGPDGDYDTAIQDFLEKYGADAIGAITPHSRNVISAVPTSLEAAQWVDANPAIKRKYDMVYGFFTPQDGEFHMPTYLQSYVSGDRETISLKEWLNVRDTLIGNYHYERFRNMLGADRFSPSDEQRAWLKEQKKMILAKYPNFNNNIGLPQRPDPERVIAQLVAASKEKKIRETDAGQGLVKYLAMREKAVAQQESLGLGSLTSKEMLDTRNWLRQHGLHIAKMHPDFERLWDIVFSREIEEDEVIALTAEDS